MSPTKHGNVLSWASDIEKGTIEQASKAASMPFVEGHLALMPDAHIGMGATIGSVIPTKGAVIPAAVGVDIGCGMIAVETDLPASRLPDSLSPLLAKVEEVVPAGVGQGHGGDRRVSLPGDPPPLSDKQRKKAREQFGSLGSGNHFVEVCLDERDVMWLVLHSGSRGIGNQLATQHIEGAKGLMKKLFVELPDPDLAYLVEGTPAFDSCSHGAGRRMSRGQARRSLTTASLAEVVGDRAWNADRARELLDEHPASYKDIVQVMADQADLVEIEHTLRQVLNYKGS